MTTPNRKIVLVDIDGTLADVSHRLHFIKGPGRKDWKSFFRAQMKDKPVEAVVRWVRELAKDHEVVLVTGRPDEYRDGTERWLKEHDIPYHSLVMRKKGDHRPDHAMKHELIDHLDRDRIAFVIDDRPLVCDMWKECGFKVFKVSAGEEY